MNTTSVTAIPSSSVHEVPFHNHNLFLIEHQCQPYVPMRPVIESMGMDWKTQHRKLKSNTERWGVVIMTIPSDGGKQQSLAMPLRKLPGFICSIHPNKVKKEIRPALLLFQNECDDVLWEHWEKKIKTPIDQQPQLPPPATTLTSTQQHAIKQAVDKIVQDHYLAPRIAYSRTWNDLKDRFRVAKYQDIPQSRFDEAMAFLGFPVTKEAMPMKTASDTTEVNTMALNGTLAMTRLINERRDELFDAQEEVKRAMERLNTACRKIHDPLQDLPSHVRNL